MTIHHYSFQPNCVRVYVEKGEMACFMYVFLRRSIDYIKKDSAECKALAPKFAAVNRKRIAAGSAVAMLVHLAHIIIYSAAVPHSSLEAKWLGHIVTTHIIMLAIMSVVFLAALMLRDRKKAGLPEYILQYALIAILMAEGAALTQFDQLVTPNITPYIILCLVSGVAFLIRPRYMLLIFAVSYIVFFWAVGVKPFCNDTVLSNRTNGFAMACISYFLSLIMWKHNALHERQRAHIERHHKELLDMANLDPLTGIYNRRKFDEIIRREIAVSESTLRESSLIMLDIDLFKSINDTYGHPAGDSILMQFSRLLSENIRKGDSLCRLGGEEFIILLPGTTEGEASAVAEKLRELIEHHIFTAGEKPVRLSASFGIARLDYSLDPTLISQYSKVDHALYIAKETGRNRVVAV